MPHVITKSPQQKKVVVVGGGPAGLEAARVCGERGHRVVLFEAAAQVGGQLASPRAGPGARICSAPSAGSRASCAIWRSRSGSTATPGRRRSSPRPRTSSSSPPAARRCGCCPRAAANWPRRRGTYWTARCRSRTACWSMTRPATSPGCRPGVRGAGGTRGGNRHPRARGRAGGRRPELLRASAQSLPRRVRLTPDNRLRGITKVGNQLVARCATTIRARSRSVASTR